MTSLYELCRRSEHGIYAVPYRGRRARKALRLPEWAVVEAPLPDQRTEAPDRVADCHGVALGGVPASSHHARLGLVIGHLPLSGVYLLPDGDVAAANGAEAIPLGLRSVPVG